MKKFLAIASFVCFVAFNGVAQTASSDKNAEPASKCCMKGASMKSCCKKDMKEAKACTPEEKAKCASMMSKSESKEATQNAAVEAKKTSVGQ